jgi:cobalt/nickel transport system permease protein
MARQRTFSAAVLLFSLLLAGVVSWFASSSPDGLERVAEDKGFSDTARDHDLAGSPLADYGVKGVGDARLRGGLAGVIGVGITLALGSGVFLTLRRRNAGTDPTRLPETTPSAGVTD